jgi:hypothetical protein
MPVRLLLPAMCAMLIPLAALAAPERRLALLISSSGDGEVRLPHARADAQRVRDALVMMAGVPPEDALLVSEPTPDDVLLALGELESRARDAKALGTPTWLFVWITATVDAGALRLGSQRLPLATLTALLQSSPADRRLAVFDLSALNRAADERAAPEMVFETRDAPGLALLTVTAPGPRAHEAPPTGGGHVAFHFANALRGGADSDGDGVVMVSEALRGVADRAGRPLDLSALDDAPLSRLEAGGLALADELTDGRFIVVDRDGRVVGELSLPGSRRLALAPGRYVVKQRGPPTPRLATVELQGQRTERVGIAAFRDAAAGEEPVRAPGFSFGAGSHWSLGATAAAQLTTTPSVPSWPTLGLELTLHGLLGGLAVAVDGSYGWASGSATPALVGPLRFSAAHLAGGLSARYEWRRDTALVPVAGVRLGLSVLTREFEGGAFAAQRFTTLLPGAFAGLELRPWRGLSVGVRVRAQALFLDASPASALVDLGGVVSWRFGGGR